MGPLWCWELGLFEGAGASQCIAVPHPLLALGSSFVSELQVVLELTDEATERPAEVAVSQLDISGHRAIFPGKEWLLGFLGWRGELSCWIFFWVPTRLGLAGCFGVIFVVVFKEIL